MHMGKASTGSNVGTGGMNTKMIAAKIATSSDVDMIIANSKDIGVLHRLLSGENEGTLFVAHKMKALICRSLSRICIKIRWQAKAGTTGKAGKYYEYG